ncbi:hypothetical protein [Methanobrevibacter sp.]|uniref:hypothetical protein n=1 Tax=Methanobrevibacter sp. TaxID=66852 RepID=UPI002710C320|nr:hypothetical protein [Methanobrevibacter sp.]
MADINELAEKKLKSRMTKIRKSNREPEEKQKFSEKLGISFEVEFQNKNPDKLTDGLTIITSPEGKVLFADYFYGIPEEDEYTNIEVNEKQLKSILEFFEDYKLELDDSD